MTREEFNTYLRSVYADEYILEYDLSPMYHLFNASVEYFGEENVCLIPENDKEIFIAIKKEDFYMTHKDLKHYVPGCIIYFKFSFIGKLSIQIGIGRHKLSIKEYDRGFIHPHTSAVPKDQNFIKFHKMCLGTGDANPLLDALHITKDEEEIKACAMSLVLVINDNVQEQSTIGTAYISIRDIVGHVIGNVISNNSSNISRQTMINILNFKYHIIPGLIERCSMYKEINNLVRIRLTDEALEYLFNNLNPLERSKIFSLYTEDHGLIPLSAHTVHGNCIVSHMNSIDFKGETLTPEIVDIEEPGEEKPIIYSSNIRMDNSCKVTLQHMLTRIINRHVWLLKKNV